MKKITWANLLHIYQPPGWPKEIITKVANESYRPVLKILKKRSKVKITLNISGSLTEQLYKKGYKDIIRDITYLANRGQIEFTGSAVYHTILPLLPSSEILRQIKLNTRVNRKYLGEVYKPKGFFPPEMAFDLKLARVLKKLGFHWFITDEIGMNGKLGKTKFDQGYLIKNIGLSIIFRNRHLSNLFFESKVFTPQGFLKEVKRDLNAEAPLITALDGENLGHHRKSMDKLFAKILDFSQFETITMSELLDQYKKKKTITPVPASWSTFEFDLRDKVPYSLWKDPKNEIHRLQWRLTNLVINTINKSKNDPGFKKARKILDQRINSDQYWWASAHPWWGVSIVVKATLNLKNTLLFLKNPPPKILRQAEFLADNIINLVEDWQETGKAYEMSLKFLKKVTQSQFFGGDKVK